MYICNPKAVSDSIVSVSSLLSLRPALPCPAATSSELLSDTGRALVGSVGEWWTNLQRHRLVQPPQTPPDASVDFSPQQLMLCWLTPCSRSTRCLRLWPGPGWTSSTSASSGPAGDFAPLLLLQSLPPPPPAATAEASPPLMASPWTLTRHKKPTGAKTLWSCSEVCWCSNSAPMTSWLIRIKR